jgi:hypothetical protein
MDTTTPHPHPHPHRSQVRSGRVGEEITRSCQESERRYPSLLAELPGRGILRFHRKEDKRHN